MHEHMRSDRKSAVVAVAAAGLMAGACASGDRGDRVWRLMGEGIEVEYHAGIDRFTYIGPAGGPNMVFTQKVDQAPAPDESYTFYGGCYTWVAPQSGTLGWRDASGAERPWPPDPAMDIGPTRVERTATGGVRIESPVNRAGLREIKEYRPEGDRTGTLEFTLENTTPGIVTGGPWVNTAVPPGGLIAVRMDDATDIWGWNEESIARFRSVARKVDGSGWALIDPADATWEGGIKVYLDGGSGGGGAAEIAIWREGWWLHRRQLAQDDGRLRRVGEGPVAVYIQPSSTPGEPAIVEAELYGRIADIAPYGTHAGIERWTLVPSATPDVWALPRGR
jgi:hypothetical protein